MRIAFATCSVMPDGDIDDRPAAEMLGARFEVWDDPRVDWDAYDRVVLRSTWDYTFDLEAFLGWCESIGPARLRNEPALVAFNADKHYLADLLVPTVPTTFVVAGNKPPALRGDVVVKPSVGAGARATGRFGPAKHREALDLIDRITASGCAAMVQPYLADVDARGETSIVLLHGELSHVVRKRAVLRPDEIAPIDTESGLGEALVMLDEDLVVPGRADPAAMALAHDLVADISARFGGPPLYARIDVVRDAEDDPVLLELVPAGKGVPWMAALVELARCPPALQAGRRRARRRSACLRDPHGLRPADGAGECHGADRARRQRADRQPARAALTLTRGVRRSAERRRRAARPPAGAA